MSLYDYSATDISGNEVSMRDLCEGKLTLVVNTASRCGFTRHYEDMQRLFMEHRDEGFTVIAFPCNQFGNQEPDSNEGILEFCQNNYDVTFPIMAKGNVQSNENDTATELWQWLGENAKGGGIYWNFHKFLIGRDGNIIDNWEMDEEMEPVIEAVKANLS